MKRIIKLCVLCIVLFGLVSLITWKYTGKLVNDSKFQDGSVKNKVIAIGNNETCLVTENQFLYYNIFFIAQGVFLLLSVVSSVVIIKVVLLPLIINTAKKLCRNYREDNIRERIFKISLIVFCISVVLIIVISFFATSFLGINNLDHKYEIFSTNGEHYYITDEEKTVQVNAVVFYTYFYFLRFVYLVLRFPVILTFFYLFFFHVIPYFLEKHNY